MAKRVTFIADCTVRLVLGDIGPIPRATIDYKAGYSGLIPDHHYTAALAKGVIHDDEGPGQSVAALEGHPGQAPAGHARGVGGRRSTGRQHS